MPSFAATPSTKPPNTTGGKPVDSIAATEKKRQNAEPGTVDSGVRNTGTEERPVWVPR